MKTIGELARQYGLSRSTLIYYGKQGLFQPSARSDAGYRLYSEKDEERLKLILTYRDGGVPLREISGLLEAKGAESTAILSRRLQRLNQEIEQLRGQQQTILRLIGKKELMRNSRVLDKESWVRILRATGLDEDDMRRWHVEFEKAMPEMHQDFLESLGIDKPEIRQIRRWAVKAAE